MNRSELIDVVAEKLNLPRKPTEQAVDLVFDFMTAAMARGDRIEIRGIGSFVVKNYGSYVGRNPRTGEPVQVGPKRLPHFKAGKELKARVDRV